MQIGQIENVQTEGLKQEKKVIIHTMPKRFVGTRMAVKGHKGAGMIILGVGFVLLLGVLSVIYFFIVKPKSDPAKIEYPLSSSDVTDESEKAPDDSDVPALSDELPDYGDSATGTGEISGGAIAIASSSPEIATVTIDANDLNGTTGTSSIPASVVKMPSQDTDQDGLSDVEEMLLDCNISKSDSDGDGYGDLEELNKLYNPAGAGKLIANPNIEKYTNGNFKYSLYYPNTWLRTNVDGENSILFRAGNEQYIQVIAQDNPEAKSLDDWYKEQVNPAIDPSQRLYKAGWSGIRSADGLIAYLNNSSQSVIYTILYNTGMDDTLVYSAIFKMIVESFAEVN